MNKVVKLNSVGAVNTAKDGRAYYSAEFSNPLNPFAKTVKRNFWQQFQTDAEGNKTPIWRGADPATVKPFVGKTIPGFFANEKVEQYNISIPGQEDRTANTYPTVVLDGENMASVYKSVGHPLAEEALAPAVLEGTPVAVDAVIE